MTRHGYPCPDCEQDDCSGAECLGKATMERHVFGSPDAEEEE